MRGFFKRLEDLFTAVAFAEGGEFDTARQILNEESQENRRFSDSGVGTGRVEEYSAGVRQAEEKRELLTQTLKA